MRAVDIIIKKRDKQELSREEIEYFVQAYCRRRNTRLPGIGLGDGGTAQRDDGA